MTQMSQIAIIGQFDIHAEDAAQAAELMRVMMNQSMKEQGCHHYTYSRDLSTPDRFQLSELWESDHALAAHFQTGHMADYRTGMSKLRVLARTVTRFDVTGVKAL
jgi:quinol monooxygenase YgiN